MASSLQDIMKPYFLRQAAATEGGSSTTTQTADTTSPSVTALTTGSRPLTLSPNTLGTSTMTTEILKGATISGGNTVNYIDIGNADTKQQLATVTVNPTIDVAGTTLLNVSLALLNNNINDIYLEPNTVYVIRTANTSIAAETVTQSLLFRRTV